MAFTLTKLTVLFSGLYNRDHYVVESCVSRGVACMCVIGGGYSSDINELSLRHTIVHRAATKVIFYSVFSRACSSRATFLLTVVFVCLCFALLVDRLIFLARN